MSTNIHNGFKFEGNILELQKELKELRETFHKISDLKMKNFFVKKMYKVFDLANYLEKEELGEYLELGGEENLFFYASRELEKYQSIHYKEAQVLIYPKEENLIYGISFISKEFGNIIRLSKKIKEYAYWNSTDKPKEISEEEWKKREELWDEIFEKENIFSEAGFSFKMAKTLGNFLPMDFEEKDLELTEEERIKNIEFDLNVLKKCKEENDKRDFKTKKLINCDLKLMFSNLNKIYEFLKEKKDN